MNRPHKFSCSTITRSHCFFRPLPIAGESVVRIPLRTWEVTANSVIFILLRRAVITFVCHRTLRKGSTGNREHTKGLSSLAKGKQALVGPMTRSVTWHRSQFPDFTSRPHSQLMSVSVLVLQSGYSSYVFISGHRVPYHLS